GRARPARPHPTRSISLARPAAPGANRLGGTREAVRGGTIGMKPAVEKVRSAIGALGLAGKVIELPVEARTTQQAADALGVAVGQIAKSLVFTVNKSPLLVIASGANRVDERKLGTIAGGKVRRADPETVKQATGYTIGGVPPLAHAMALPVYIDP